MATRRLLLPALVCLACSARAHQFLQGRLETIVYRNKVVIWASVPLEEVVIQLLLPVDDNLEVNTQAAAYRDHGKYLLKHIAVSADKRILAGKVLTVQEPNHNKITIGAPSGEYVRYELEYPVASPPAALEITQNILHEVEFSPGTPWQMSFIAGIRQDQKTGRENLLLDSTTKIDFACDWSAQPKTPKTQPATSAQSSHVPPEALTRPIPEAPANRTPFILGVVIGVCVIYLVAIVVRKSKRK